MSGCQPGAGCGLKLQQGAPGEGLCLGADFLLLMVFFPGWLVDSSTGYFSFGVLERVFLVAGLVFREFSCLLSPKAL